jgi:hypothetical protein
LTDPADAIVDLPKDAGQEQRCHAPRSVLRARTSLPPA